MCIIGIDVVRPRAVSYGWSISCYNKPIPQSLSQQCRGVLEMEMKNDALKVTYSQGRECLSQGKTAEALAIFQELGEDGRQPLDYSGMGYCLAKERRLYTEAISLCKEAVRRDPREPKHFYYLGMIHLLAGQKRDAIRIFRMGLRCGKCPDIVAVLRRMGIRRSPILPFLARSNPINKYLGIAMAKLNIR